MKLGSFKFIIPVLLFLSLSGVHAQCPSNEADLANGGTFSGNCTIDVGGSITITGAVVWTSGRLTINDDGGGGDGDMYINNGGSVTIQNGATLDMDDGDITVRSGASLSIDAGGTVEIMDNNDRYLWVDGGSLTVAGSLEVRDDIWIDNGGTAVFSTGSTVVSHDDLVVLESSTLTIESGSTVTLSEEFDIDDSNVTIAGTVQSTGPDDLNISGNSVLTIQEGADLTFNDVEFGTGDGATQFIIDGGNVTLNGEVDFNGGTDGDAIVVNGGVLEVGNDIEIGSTDATITVNSGGTVNAPSIDDDAIDDPDDLPDNIIISGGDFNIGGNMLPVELLSFKGALYEGQQIALLEWITATEINNKGFYIEKSEDGKTFESLGFVEGNGTTSDVNEYTFLDYNLRVSSYYRLLQVDFDGDFEYSKMIFVSTVLADSPNPIKLYPNPTQSDIRVDGLIEEIYDIQITDVSGKLLFKAEDMRLSDSENYINRELDFTGDGMLIVRFSNPGYTKVIRVIKE